MRIKTWTVTDCFRTAYIYRFSVCLFLLGLSILSLSCKTTKAMEQVPSELESIKQVLMTQQAAWNEGDIAAFMQGYWNSPELSFIGSSGVTRGWQATLDNYIKGYPDKDAMGQLHFDIIELQLISDDAAYMIGKYTLTRKEDQPSGYFNLLWKKVNGSWVICSDHTSS